MDIKEKNKLTDMGFAAALLACVLFLIWKAPYGFHFLDEAYYLAIPYRMLQGDKLVNDIWELTQFSMLPTVPLVKIYLAIFGSTEGMVFRFRYIYLFFHSLFTLWIYASARRSSKIAAAAAALIYMLFSPLNVLNFSYNTYGIGFLTMSGFLLAYPRKERLEYPLSGFMFALVVLCSPYTAIVYFAYSLKILIFDGKEKRKKWLLFTSGTAAAAVGFLILLFANASLSELILNLPYIFRDPTHPIGSYGARLAEMLKDLLLYRKPIGAVLLAEAAVAVIYSVDKKCREHRWMYCVAACAAAVFGIIYQMKTDHMINHAMVPVCYLGFAAYFMCKEKDTRLFGFVYISGGVYAASIYLSSDLGYSAMAGALSVCATASAVFIVKLSAELCAEGRRYGKISAAALACVLLCQIGAQVWYRKNFSSCEYYNTAMMYETVDKSCGKGEKTSTDTLQYEYLQVYESSEKVRNAPGENVLYFAKDCWLYLEDEKHCASYSLWLQVGYTVEEAERLAAFWEINPEKKPDAIYISTEIDAEKVIEILNTENFPVEKNDRAYIMIREEKPE